MTKTLACAPFSALVALAALLMGGAGCQYGPSLSTTPQGRYDAAWDASLQVLREYHFEIDRTDRREGLITTYPLTGASWFEPARKDAATCRDSLESTLQTIHRTAEVRLRRSEAGYYFPQVRVSVSRAYRSEQQITNASEAYGLFRLDSPAERLRRPWRAGPPPQQVPLGEDQRLAERIAADIEGSLER